MDARPAPNLMATLGVLCQDYILRQIGSRLLSKARRLNDNDDGDHLDLEHS